MTKEEARNELIYQLTMSAARHLLMNGLITQDQYEQFDTIMRQKYVPVIGELFTNVNLL